MIMGEGRRGVCGGKIQYAAFSNYHCCYNYLTIVAAAITTTITILSLKPTRYTNRKTMIIIIVIIITLSQADKDNIIMITAVKPFVILPLCCWRLKLVLRARPVLVSTTYGPTSLSSCYQQRPNCAGRTR